MKVRDVMTREVISVPPEMPLRELARLLTERQISGVPVVDEAGRCIGIVSEADVVTKQVSRPVSRRLPLEWLLGERQDPEEQRRRAATTAGEAMTTPPITIGADRPIREVAATMVDRRVNRLPVVEEDGRLVGVVSRADLVRAYLRLDADIRETVRDDIIRGTMWLDPDDLEIKVKEGIVEIGGTVDRRSTARIIEKLIGLADGVAGVRSSLAWEFDDSGIEPAGDLEREPGAASITARREPPPMHR